MSREFLLILVLVCSLSGLVRADESPQKQTPTAGISGGSGESMIILPSKDLREEIFGISLAVAHIRHLEEDILSPDSSLRNKEGARKINDELYTVRIRIKKAEKALEPFRSSSHPVLEILYLDRDKKELAELEKIYIKEIKGKFTNEAKDAPSVTDNSKKEIHEQPVGKSNELEQSDANRADSIK